MPTTRTWIFTTLLCLLIPLVPWGCAGYAGDFATADEAPAYRGPQSSSAPSGELGLVAGMEDDVSSSFAQGKAKRSLDTTDALAEHRGEDDSESASATEGRKLIRTGDISVNVDDYAPFREALDDRLDEMGGFVSDASLDHWSGRVSWATLTVRVSADRFDELVGWAEAEVEVSSLNISTQDVTEEWVDVRSRIDNHKATEKRLLEILDTRTADLGDVLAVERELARVREEIERAEGRLRVLSDQVDLATLTIHVSVRNPYEPAVDPPGFGQTIADVFLGSIEIMVNVAKGLVLLLVGASPWLAVLFVFAFGLYRVIRALVRRKSA